MRLLFDPDATAEPMTAGIESSLSANPLLKGNVFKGGTSPATLLNGPNEQVSVAMMDRLEPVCYFRHRCVRAGQAVNLACFWLKNSLCACMWSCCVPKPNVGSV